LAEVAACELPVIEAMRATAMKLRAFLIMLVGFFINLVS